MPRDKSYSDYSSHKSRSYRYKPYSSQGKGPAVPQENPDYSEKKDWEDVTCPICMETPHNAVLLKCSSYDKGCRPYMCDTSHRHSNCLDQFCKAHAAIQKAHVNARESGLAQSAVEINSSGPHDVSNETFVRSPQTSRRNNTANNSEQGEILNDEMLEDVDGCTVNTVSRGLSQSHASSLHGHDLVGLLCPLCRGHVKGWEVIKAARRCLNMKARSCAWEACSFTGCYEELRAHARHVHPTVRPTEIDPVRQRDWRLLERQRDLGDLLSTIRSAMPGATVFGDYAIDGQEDHLDGYDSDFPGDEGHLWTFFLWFQVFGPAQSFIGGRAFPQFRDVVSGHHRMRSTRRGLWGEILQRPASNESNGFSANSSFSGSPPQRRRRSQRRSQG